jgi:hypothetical protein
MRRSMKIKNHSRNYVKGRSAARRLKRSRRIYSLVCLKKIADADDGVSER